MTPQHLTDSERIAWLINRAAGGPRQDWDDLEDLPEQPATMTGRIPPNA